jgi:Ca-activated chloride channel family protein
MIGDFHFLRPAWLLAILAAVILARVVARQEDMRTRWQHAIAPHLLGRLLIDRRSARRIQPLYLTVFLMALAAVAAAGPTWRKEQAPFVEDEAPLAIALDLSRSMDAVDVSPTRLERAKLKIHDLLAMRKGARTALFVYAGSAHMVLPLTDDANLIGTYADALETRIMPIAGKDTAAALAAVEAGLASERVPGTVLLLTDGVEPGAFDAFKKQGGRNQIMILAIGTAEGGLIKTDTGDYDGDASASRLDTDALRKLKAETGVELATLTLDDTDVRWITRRMATHFQHMQSEGGGRWQDFGWWLMIPIVALSALWFRRGWTIRWATYGVPLALAFAAHPADAGSFWDAWLTPDQEGAIAFRRNDYETAAKRFADPMWQGVAAYRADEFDQAADIFARVNSPEAFYDEGNAQAFLGKLPQAAASYERALKKRPDWPEAKANLKLVEDLIAKKKKEDEQEADEPQDDPDQIKFDDKGKRGKRGTVVNLAEQSAEIWMRNIQTTPTDLLARRFALEAKASKP